MENVRIYFLDVSTLITILARQKRSGTLQADSVHIPSIRGNVLVSLVIADGTVQSCYVVQKRQKILEGEQAYSALLALPALEWQWRPLVSLPAPPQPDRGLAASSDPVNSQQGAPVASSGPANKNPQQTVGALDSSILQQLSRYHRRVLSLCDGTRSFDKIATMLFMSPKDLSIYIRDLEQWGLVQFR
jgi:hypothetical protein